MADPCRVATQPRPVLPLPRSSPDTATIFGGGLSNRIDRTSPRVLVEVEKRDLKKFGFQPLIQEVEVTEELGKIPHARVVIADPEGKFVSDPLWLEGRQVRISTGYPTTQLASRGRFVIATPMFEFGARRRIELACFGEEIRLATTERRRAFSNLTDSDLVRQVAKENGFEAVVQDTTTKYPQITQANKTDGQLLKERAQLYGYEFYVEEGKIHFHEPRAETTGIVLRYRGGQESTLGRLKVGVSCQYRALTASLTQVDPLSGEVFDLTSQESQDEITSAGLKAAQGEKRTWKDIASVYGGGEKFVVGGGHLQQRGARAAEIEGLSRLSRWVVDAHGESEGIETMRVRRTIKILGAGRWSGDYRIVKTIHKFRPGYRVHFELARTWTGQPGQESPVLVGGPGASTAGGGLSDVSNRSPLAGIAVEVP